MPVTPTTAAPATDSVNIARRLTEMAAQFPHQVAVAVPQGRHRGRREYETVSFAQLDRDSSVLASGLRRMGVGRGHRLVLMVRPGIDFVSLTFALLKSGAVVVLVDPGMGKKNVVQCLADVTPDGFVAISPVHAVRSLLRHQFPRARFNVTVGPRWFWGGATLRGLRSDNDSIMPVAATRTEDHAAIIFTSGSTGPPKGVLYTHGTFQGQVDQICDRYAIEPGGVDVAGFPLFGLFNAAMGTTTIVPDMDASRPASVDPQKYIEAIHDWNANQSFASPAVWNAVGRYCNKNQMGLPSLRRVLSAGAPVPVHVLRWISDAIHPAGEVYTPYGATESLPVASISATEVLSETADRTQHGAGTCVGKRFSGIEWKVIAITDAPIRTIDEVVELPMGETGELIVTGPVVTEQYVTRTGANRLAKIEDRDGGFIWHRMGDVGYIDEQDRFWFCGRKSHRVRTSDGTLFTVPCESIFNNHKAIYRSALVGVGDSDTKTPIIVCEPWPDDWPSNDTAKHQLRSELAEMGAAHWLTNTIQPHHILFHRSLPVDIRHNAKIFREEISKWAAAELAKQEEGA